MIYTVSTVGFMTVDTTSKPTIIMAGDLVITPYCNKSMGTLQYAHATDTLTALVAF